MPRTIALALSAYLVGSPVLPLAAQSLADVARREEDRRKTVKAGGRTITNRDLQSVPPTTAVSPPAPDAGAARPETGAPGQADKKPTEGTKDQGQTAQKDQKYWRDRLIQLQTQLDRDKTFAEALQTRINSLTTDFVNRDDPAQRTAIGNERQKSIEELNRLKKAIVDGTKAITDLEEEARRAGVPPGWLR